MKSRAIFTALLAAGLVYLASVSSAEAGLRSFGGEGCGCEPKCCAPEPTCCAIEKCCRSHHGRRCCKPACEPKCGCGAEPTCAA